MAANRDDINRWIQTAKDKKSKFIISVCDTWDYDDYPIYCSDETEMHNQYASHDGVNMQKINEVIKIDGDKVIENYSIYK